VPRALWAPSQKREAPLARRTPYHPGEFVCHDGGGVRWPAPTGVIS
jgi:hypothetical protein